MRDLLAPTTPRSWSPLVLARALLVSPAVALGWPSTTNGLMNGYDYASSLAVDAAGNAFVTGTMVDQTPGPFTGSFPVAKFDALTGAVLWHHDVAGNDPYGLGDEGKRVLLDVNGDVVVGG